MRVQIKACEQKSKNINDLEIKKCFKSYLWHFIFRLKKEIGCWATGQPICPRAFSEQLLVGGFSTRQEGISRVALINFSLSSSRLSHLPHRAAAAAVAVAATRRLNPRSIYWNINQNHKHCHHSSPVPVNTAPNLDSLVTLLFGYGEKKRRK